MANFAPWAVPNKESGNGNDTVSWSASPHTGREARQTQATFAASGVSPSPVLTVIQSGKAEFVSFDSASASVGKNGGTLTITGKSNSSKLLFSLTGNNGIGLVLPSSYLANSVSTNNGAAIAGDPGATQEYAFSIAFTNIPANTSVESLLSQLTVTDDAGNTATCDITQAAGDAYLTISPTTITIPAAGTPAQSVTVSSNTNWTIS